MDSSFASSSLSFFQEDLFVLFLFVFVIYAYQRL
ncbi:unnamed protein product [Brassica rapa subsp. narinosa]